MTRYAARVDANHAEIVAALRDVGAGVVDLSRVGSGVPDVLCSYRGVNYLLEIKTPTGKLTNMEAEWLAAWEGQARIVRSVTEALQVIGAVD